MPLHPCLQQRFWETCLRWLMTSCLFEPVLHLSVSPVAWDRGIVILSLWLLQVSPSRFPGMQSENPADGPGCLGASGVWSAKKDTCQSTIHGCLNHIQAAKACSQRDCRILTQLSKHRHTLWCSFLITVLYSCGFSGTAMALQEVFSECFHLCFYNASDHKKSEQRQLPLPSTPSTLSHWK